MTLDTYFVRISNLESSQKPSSNIFLFFCLNKLYLSLMGYVTSCLTSTVFASVVQSFGKKEKSKRSILVIGYVNGFCHGKLLIFPNSRVFLWLTVMTKS